MSHEFVDRQRVLSDGTVEEPCGFRSHCGRPLGHRGHHGGWRTGIRAVEPGLHGPDGEEVPGSDLTPTEVTMLAEIVVHGTMPKAAACLGRSVQGFKNHMTAIHVRTGSPTTIEALRRLGWLQVPPGALRHG